MCGRLMSVSVDLAYYEAVPYLLGRATFPSEG